MMTLVKVLFSCVLLGTVLADDFCPFYGSEYPPPTDLPDNSIFAAAAANLTNTLNSALSTDARFNTTSFAIQIFSTEDSASIPLFAHYHTSPATQQATVGVTEITGDTVWRIASISKAWSVYLWLINAEGDKYFNEPITTFIPELRNIALHQRLNKTESADAVDFSRWQDITIGELAGQMAGIARDCMCDYSACNHITDFLYYRWLHRSRHKCTTGCVAVTRVSQLDCSRASGLWLQWNLQQNS